MDLKQFDNDKNAIMNIFTMITQLMIINFLTVLFSSPVITAGASFAAMHDCLQRIIRKEDGYTVRNYIASFRDNLKQGSLLLFCFLPLFLGIAGDILLCVLSPGLLPRWVTVPAGVAGFLSFFIFLWVFPILARFRLTVAEILRLSLFLCVARFPRTISMAMMWIIPVFCFRFVPLIPLCLLFGLTLPGFLNALFYLPVFGELEEEKNERERKKQDVILCIRESVSKW
ncbi:MAG: DUF624 domain-containing protein [Lachnospiraceae bacterium]|nr:DUF624 domain-containing protein [Lachnospiraceae bacterium]